MPKTLKEQYQEYESRVYKWGIGKNQQKQVQQAWLGGAVAVTAALADLSGTSKEDASTYVNDLLEEIMVMIDELPEKSINEPRLPAKDKKPKTKGESDEKTETEN